MDENPKIIDLVRTRPGVKCMFVYKDECEKSGPVFEQTIDMWWTARLFHGCQLVNLEGFKISYDFKGNKNWKEAVTIAALHTDFMASVYGRSVDRSLFMSILRKRLGHVRTSRERVWMTTDKGARFLRPYRSFIYFNDVKYHRNFSFGR